MMESLDNWWEEKRSAYLYTVIASLEKNLVHKKLFLDLKEAADQQAKLWENKMLSEGMPVPKTFSPDMRTRTITWLLHIFGTENLHSILSTMKIRGMSVFTSYHNEHGHTSLSSSSNLRAAVFGVNDGLISNMSLILGIAGASTNQHFIVVAGVAGLLAGACSMGAGEYVSVRSQREVFEYQIAIEKQELEEYPEEEMKELSFIYQARGLPLEEADKLAKLMIDNPEIGLNTLAREELGLNPEDLISPIGAMIASFFSFAIGAAIPLLPFLFGNHTWNIYVSMACTGFALFTIGAGLCLYTNRNPLWLGFRMLGIGTIAGVLTFCIGKLLGVTV